MAVFRVERTRDYTVMSNHHLRDKTLSLKAKGLLSLMLSLPEDWDYTLSGLAVSAGGEGCHPWRHRGAGAGRVRPAAADYRRGGQVWRQ